jgi:hypothetical protein
MAKVIDDLDARKRKIAADAIGRKMGKENLKQWIRW